MSEKRKGGNFFMEKTKNMFLTSAKELKTTSTLAVCAMLAALALILNSVASINIGPYVKIGFSGIPNQIADYLFGPITGFSSSILSWAVRTVSINGFSSRIRL